MKDEKQNPDVSIELPTDQGGNAPDHGRTYATTDAGIVEVNASHSRHVPDSSYENYLFGKAGQEDRQAWSDSMKGRAAIRLVSRGIVGSAFFVIGGRMASQQMATYDEHALDWSMSKPFHNWLQPIAKGIDMTLGKGYKMLYRQGAKEIGALGNEAKDTALRFRHTRDFIANGQPTKGRSYGAEVVGFTFDFAMASIGDATTRNLIQVIDPNVKKSWLVNNDGKPASHGEHKHFDFNKWAKATAATSWRIFSKNQGEDWFAGLTGYAFQMKFQSKLLNNVFKGKRTSDGLNAFEGHDIVFDRGWNGGAYRRNILERDARGNITKAEIVGDYQLAGAIDLHARFVGYNWYTLMFREGYDRIGNAINEWKKDGYAIHAPHLPQHFNPITAAVDGVADTGRYLAKSFIKANMYMNPAVVPFWILRTSQSKWRGEQFIDVENHAMLDLKRITPGTKSKLEADTHVFSESKLDKLKPYASSNYDHYPTKTVLDRFEKRFSQTLNFFGRGQYVVGKGAGKVANIVGESLPQSKWFNELTVFNIRDKHPELCGTPEGEAALLKKGRLNFAHEFTDAAIAYTPYMYAKQEFGLRVDDNKGDGKPGQMDKAIYRFMDNVASFNMPATWTSVKEMWQLGTHFEQDAPVREGGDVKKVPEPNAIRTQTFADSTTDAQTPTTTVATADATHEAANFARRAGDTKPPADEDKSWAQSVIGNNVNPAQIMSAGATRH